jgi:hypothetical protein
MHDIPKHIKRLLREQASLAYEEELRRALLPLAAAFDDWKAGQMSSGDLTGLIHDFHHGPAHELYNKYNHGPLDLVVAYAIVGGILDQAHVPTELRDHLSRALTFYEAQEPGK